jgi:hypothetical protein
VPNLDPSAKILDIDLSNPGSGQSGVPPSNTVFGSLDVYAAKATGVGKWRLVNAERRYQDFDVRICGKDKTSGGTIKQGRFILHTKRPKTRRKILVHVFREIGAGVYEYPSTIEDDGRPYAQDFEQRAYKPVGHLGCALK